MVETSIDKLIRKIIRKGDNTMTPEQIEERINKVIGKPTGPIKGGSHQDFKIKTVN